MTKILYVIPPYFDYTSHLINDKLPSFTIPYGILSIDSYIKKNIKNIESQLLDFNVEINKYKEYNLNKLNDIIKEFSPDVVAISALFNTSYNHLNEISTVIKQCSNSIFIVSGGGLSTNLYEKILNECHSVDAICYGEGEIPITEFLHSKLNPNFKHQSWITRNSLRERQIPINSFVYNLDDIPIFDYKLLNLDDYNNRSIDRISNIPNKREMSIHTSRGCPFDCVFCANSSVHGKKVRYMSIEKVIDEVDNMTKNYNMTTLMIEDDHFLYDKNRAKELLIKLQHYDINIEFPNGIALHSIDEEIGKLLKEAGTTTIALAVESGSDYVLKNIINKPHTSKMINKSVEILRKNNIQIQAFIVIGLPGETDEHRQETLDMLKNVGFDWTHIFLAVPIVGSRLYDICINNNYLVDNDMSNHVTSKACIKTPTIDPLKIESYAYFMNLYINFVHNYNMKQGKYERAKSFFENVIKKYPNHAFAYYYLAKAQSHLNTRISIIMNNYKKFNDIILKDDMWKYYSDECQVKLMCPIW